MIGELLYLSECSQNFSTLPCGAESPIDDFTAVRTDVFPECSLAGDTLKQQKKGMTNI